MRLLQLKALHQSMRAHALQRYGFEYRDGRGRVRGVFCVDSAPYQLLIAISSEYGSHAFCVGVLPGYVVRPYLGDDYAAVRQALGIKGGNSTAEPWSPAAFFEKMNTAIPAAVIDGAPPPPLDVIQRCRPDVEESEKIHFVGWLVHSENGGGHVTQRNLDKTYRWLGAEAGHRCERSNISSRWSANPAEARPLSLPRVRV